MYGIKMSDCKFYIDEAARTVVCVIPEKIGDPEKNSDHRVKDMVYDFIAEHLNEKDVSLYESLTCWDSYKFMKELEMPRSFTGKAKCMPEDKWDADTGCLIAYSKAREKCYRSFFKRANKFVQRVDMRLGDAINAFNDFGLKLENRREALEDQIEERVPQSAE